MLKTDKIIVVEGKYDAIKLSNIIDAVIIKTEGFGIFKDKEKQEFLKRLGKEKGLVILTDSDSAGFLIRNFIKSLIPEEYLTHVYIPDIYGKERRKTERSCEGKLGVEGVPDHVLKELLVKSGVTGTEDKDTGRKIESYNFLEDGFSGKDGSSGRRLALQQYLGLPENLTCKQLLKLLNKLYTYKDYEGFAKMFGEKSEKIELPKYIEKVLSLLMVSGYEAYAVGGSIRDTLLNRKPYDWDVTTSALPEQVEKVFEKFNVIEIGIKHGTITVIVEGNPVEITTYRVDGEYRDGRHPDSVSFTGSLREDLERRDFTVNAIAYNNESGLMDPFHGRADIGKRIIRTVGNPKKRFDEDALRILRALRFSGTLGFTIHPETASAIRKQYQSLFLVSGERKAIELKKLVLGEYMESVMLEYREVFIALLPGINRKEYEKAVKQASLAPANFEIRFAFFIRIIKEPEKVFEEYHFSNRERDEITVIAENLNTDLTENHNRYIMCKMLNKYGSHKVELILLAKQAQEMFANGTIVETAEAIEEYQHIIENNIPYKIKDMDIKGEDLIKVGIKEGPELGRILSFLLDEIMRGNVKNSKAELLQTVNEMRN